MKIYLSPSNQPANFYNGVVYNGVNTNEKREMEDLALQVQKILSDYDVDVVMADFTKTIVTRPKEARSHGADLYLALHSNAGSTTAVGAVALYHPDQFTMLDLGNGLVNALDATREKLIGVKSNRAKKVYSGMDAYNGAGYAEVREPYKMFMRALILEVDFHSNPVTALYITSYKSDIAKAIAAELVRYYNLKLKKDPVVWIYKVQVGAFISPEKAEALAEDLKKDGYPVYIKKEKKEGL